MFNSSHSLTSTLQRAILDLHTDAFTHDQLYTALKSADSAGTYVGLSRVLGGAYSRIYKVTLNKLSMGQMQPLNKVYR